MALRIPRAGLQLEEDFPEAIGHLPTQAFILDLDDDVIDGMIESVAQGHEIRLSLGNKPTFLYGSTSYHIEPTFEDETDDIELFLTTASTSAANAERLPQLAMSLFRKPEVGSPWAHYRNSSSEDEDEEEYEELASSPEPEDDEQAADGDGLDSDIALLKNSLAQREAEKMEKSARVIEGSAPAPNGKSSAKRAAAGSLQKALSGRRSPFNRTTSLSPLPTSPSLSAVGSPSLAAADASSLQAAERARRARSPIIHELAFKEQSYGILWQKYPGSSEADFRSALEKVADLDEETQNYALRKKYWKELDVWRHDYASEEERQQAIDNAVRQYDKMRLSTAEPEWEKLLPKEERGQGRVLSKVQVSIAKGPSAPKVRVQKATDGSSPESGASNDPHESGSGSGSSRTDEDGGADSEPGLSPSRQTGAGAPAVAKKKITAREAQEKRLLSTKKKNVPSASSSSSNSSISSSIKVSPVKPTGRANNSNDKQGKYKSKEFVSESDTSDSESESAPLSTTVHQSKLAAANVKSSAFGASKASTPARATPVPSSAEKERPRKEGNAVRKPRPSPSKEAAAVKAQIVAKPLLKKRSRDEDEDSSSSSSSGTPLSKRIKPLKSAPKAAAPPTRDARDARDARDRHAQHSQQPPVSLPPPARTTHGNQNGGSARSNGVSNGDSAAAVSAGKAKNTSPVKSSPLASSPPTNASELDLSSEESVPPIGGSSTSRKRKMADDRRRNHLPADGTSGGNSISSKAHKKRRHLPEDLVEKAIRFKAYYEQYEALYKDVASRTNPPKDKVAELLKLHHRLQEMKRDIHSEAMIRP